MIGDYILSGVSLEDTTYNGEPALKIAMPSEANQNPKIEQLSDRDFMDWLPLAFSNGVIEVDVMSELAPDAPDYARGFIGLTFRIDDKGRFESIYLRPTNSTADNQVRRNHSVQYVAYPDYRFYQLRTESPERYESYAELDLMRWIHMKIVVSGKKALYVDNNIRLSLIVNDVKLGGDQRGGRGRGRVVRGQHHTIFSELEDHGRIVATALGGGR